MMYPKNWPDSEPAFVPRLAGETRNQEDDRLMGCALFRHADVLRKAIADHCTEIAADGFAG